MAVLAIMERFLLLWLVLLAVVAYFWPVWLPGVWDPFLGTAPGLNYLFAVTMLAIGSLLPRDEIRQVARRWPTVLGGTAVQYLSMPALAYCLARLLGLEGAALVGVLIAGCVPGAMASNVLTLVARGNVSYSVSLTTSATLLSPLVAPFALWIMLRQWIDFPVLKVSWQLCWMVVLPVVAGHLLARAFDGTGGLPTRDAGSGFRHRAGAIIANLTILWIIAVVVAKNRDNLSQVEARLLLALVALNLFGYLTGMFGSLLLRLRPPMRRALTLEVGMQNAGLGTVLAMDIFGKDPAVAIAPAIYTFGCMLTGTILARLWAQFGSG